MTRNRPKRMIALVMAMVFLLLGAGDMLGVHPCPHHEPAAFAVEHGDVPDPAGAHHQHGEEPASPDEEPHGQCTCQGVCPTSAVDDLPAEATLLEAVAELQDFAPIVDGVDLLLPRFIPFLLPYGQAPPLDS